MRGLLCIRYEQTNSHLDMNFQAMREELRLDTEILRMQQSFNGKFLFCLLYKYVPTNFLLLANIVRLSIESTQGCLYFKICLSLIVIRRAMWIHDQITRVQEVSIINDISKRVWC